MTARASSAARPVPTARCHATRMPVRRPRCRYHRAINAKTVAVPMNQKAYEAIGARCSAGSPAQYGTLTVTSAAWWNGAR